MNYTPNELENLKLPQSLRGYKVSFVEDLIEKMVQDFAFLISENSELKVKIDLLNEGVRHYKNLEESIKNTLMIAQQTADEVKKTAYEKAENIIKEARIKAKEIGINSENKAYETQKNLEEMEKTLYTYKAKSGALLKAQLEIIERLVPDSRV